MAKKTADDVTLKLLQEIARRKSEIASAERSNWKTNCSFPYQEGSANTVNLHVENNVQTLVSIAAFLMQKSAAYDNAAKYMQIEAPDFKWAGFTPDQWIDDIKLRISKVQIASARKKLEVLETRANAIISPELRTQLELEAIQAELNL